MRVITEIFLISCALMVGSANAGFNVTTLNAENTITEGPTVQTDEKVKDFYKVKSDHDKKQLAVEEKKSE